VELILSDNHIMTEIIAIWFPRAGTMHTSQHKKIIVEDQNEIKPTIGGLLFNDGADNLLVKFNKRMFVIEAKDRVEYTYNRREITYHPLQSMFSEC